MPIFPLDLNSGPGSQVDFDGFGIGGGHDLSIAERRRADRGIVIPTVKFIRKRMNFFARDDNGIE